MRRLVRRWWARRETVRFERRAERQREAARRREELLRGDAGLRAPGRLAVHELQVFSQNGEDGVIAEIFRRIGPGQRRFVEFGCGNGIENNTLLLLHRGWRGVWFDADRRLVDRIRRSHRHFVDTGSLVVAATPVTAANVGDLFAHHGVPTEVDLVSIDIDGDDYWVWEALQGWRPRVVVVEYNAMWPPDLAWVQAPAPGRGWDGTSHHGAGLGALVGLGRRKGYELVHCDLAGVNAFFVRRDLVGDHFPGPRTAEHLWQPPRYDLSVPPARRRGLGPFVVVET